jgi:putative adhesin
MMMRQRRVLALLAAFAVALLAGARPALADYHSEKALKLSPGGRLVMDLSVGSVTVTGTSESGARIEVTSNRDDLNEMFSFDFEESAGEARVIVRKKYSFHWPNRLWVHFDVRVPTETQLEVKTSGGSVEISRLRRDADLNTSGGSIKVSELAANLLAHTSGGSVGLREVTGNAKVDTSGGSIEGDTVSGALDVRTSGGSIRLEKVRGDLLAHTSGGSIHIDDAAGKVDASTSGGSVEVAFAKGNARGGQVETSGGGVRVSLDPSVNLDLEAEASSGRVTSDVPIQTSGTISTSHLHGKIGSGGETLRVHSDGGPIHIEAR